MDTILTDSLQILENEAVQHAVSNARCCGILIGICIMAVLMAGLSLMLNMVDKKQRKAEEKVDALTTYIRLIMEKNWVNIIGTCRECIKGDIRLARPIVDLFNEFSECDDEGKVRMIETLAGIIRRYGELMDRRRSVVEALDPLVENDLKNIEEEMAMIERQYPEETAGYREELEQHPTNKQNNDAEASSGETINY